MTRPDEIAALADDKQAFEIAYKHLDLTQDKDAWGRLKYMHSHCHALWEGWHRGREALRLSATSPGDAVRKALIDALTVRTDDTRDDNKRILDALRILRTTPAAVAPAEKAGDDRSKYESLLKTLRWWRDNSTANSIELTRAEVIVLADGMIDELSYADLRASGGVFPEATAPAEKADETDYKALFESHEKSLIELWELLGAAGQCDAIGKLKNLVAATPTPPSGDVASYIEALTPSAGTKASYISEFHFTVPDGHGERRVTVPWDTIKQIMLAIREMAIRSDGNGAAL